MSNDPKPPLGDLARATAMASMVLVALISYPGAGLVLGWLLRKWLGLSDWVYFPLGLLGFGLGIYHVIFISEKWKTK